MELWTAWVDHYMKGEGRTLKALICYADTQENIRAKFAEEFSDYLECKVERGVVRNSVTNYLFSDRHLQLVQSESGNAKMRTCAQFHIDFSGEP